MFWRRHKRQDLGVREYDGGLVFPDRTVYDLAGDVRYEPFVSDDGRVGYRVSTLDWSHETYIYFNPSSNTPEAPDNANVFVYIGRGNDPSKDESQHFHVLCTGTRFPDGIGMQHDGDSCPLHEGA